MDLPAPVSPVSTFRPGREFQRRLFDQYDVTDGQRREHRFAFRISRILGGKPD